MDKAIHSEFEGHTPGPWKYIAGDNTTFPHVLIPMHYQLGGEKKFDRLTVNVGAGPNEIHEANAKLIAAAPDLLKENQSLRSELQKQKELNAEFVNGLELANKAFVDSLNKYIDWIPTQEINEAFTLIESLIKKSKPA